MPPINRHTNSWSPLTGLVAATFTPLSDDGSINLQKIPEVVNHLLRHSIAGMYVLGSTGEGLSLTTEERYQVAEAFVDAAAGRLPVIVQVGCECLTAAQQLAAHAQQIGADAVSAVSPVYFKPSSAETLVESMAEIARGAPELPFYYYHIPHVTGVDQSMLDFLRIGGTQIPTLRGIKYTSTNVDEFRACVELAGSDFEVLWGLDELLYDGLSAGARAAVGSTYNFAAPIYHRLLSAFAKNDHEEARRQQAISQSIVDTFVPFGSRPAQKTIMSLAGPDCGPCRLPLKSLSASQTDDLKDQLETLGFFAELAEPRVRSAS